MTDCRRVGTRIVVSRTAILPVDEGIVTMQWLLENFGVAPPAGNGRTYAVTRGGAASPRRIPLAPAALNLTLSQHRSAATERPLHELRA